MSLYRKKNPEEMDFRAKDIKDTNSLRSMLGLPKIVVKNRKCLRCTKEFFSEGFNNRLCGVCENGREVMVPAALLYP